MSGKYCVIGRSLPHTMSPLIHSAFGREGYDVVELADELALKKFVESREYDGYNVTIPYKRDIMSMLDEVSCEAQAVGAVNTVVEEDGRLVGYNTDVGGMRFALERAGIVLKDRHVLILGSGGTCQTAKYVCSIEGARSVNVVSRTGAINYSNCYDLKDTQVVINTTPVGMMPNADEKPIELSRFDKLEGVFDCIYNPLRTKLVLEAQAMGVKAANGLDMLVEQGRLAHNHFERAIGGEELGKEKSDDVARTLILERKNIVLIGMAGSGKSVIGKRLGQALKREVCDTDSSIYHTYKKSAGAIISERGEKAFRAIESEEIKRVCSKMGLVISVGGGAVLGEDNVFYMRSNGICVWLDRPPHMLATKDRPLSSTPEKALELYNRRYPIYESVADIHIINDKASLDEVTDEILKTLKKH